MMIRQVLYLGIIATVSLCAPVAALDTGFSYQGQLKDAGVPANGDYDFVFRLFDAPTGPAQVGSDVVVEDLSVSEGYFTVQIDFGAGVFSGENRWIEVAVRPGASGGGHTTLTPRHSLTAAPYALYSLEGPGGAGGHWTDNGADIYNTNTGNVGIGTASPDATLQVINGGVLWAISAESPHGGVHGLYDAATGTNPGVQGETNSTSAEASGVRGVVTSTAAGSGSAGVWGVNQSTGATGSGVWGSQDGSGVGVYGTCPDGIGVFGKATGGTGENYAVYGRTFSNQGFAGYFRGGKNYFEGRVGIGTTTPGSQLEVIGTARVSTATIASGYLAVDGPGSTNVALGAQFADDQDNGFIAVMGPSSFPKAHMVVNDVGDGVVAADIKNFVSPNPLDPREDIWYACVEGPEAAMYVRGTGLLVDGRATIELPDHFRDLAAKDGLTVQLTPRTFDSLGLATGARDLNIIEVGELHGGSGNYEFDWEVKAVRRAHQDYQVTRPWTHVLPATDQSLNEVWAARLVSIERREQRIREMEERLAKEQDTALD